MSAITTPKDSSKRPSHPSSETEDNHVKSPPNPRLRRASDVGGTLPSLAHRLRHNNSILTIALSEDRIYAGTQGGEILVYDLETYERIAVIKGHRGSVLGLYLCKDEGLLFSTAGDRITNAWNTKTFQRAYCLYSVYDIGDVFCVAYTTKLETVYSVSYTHLTLPTKRIV